MIYNYKSYNYDKDIMLKMFLVNKIFSVLYAE